MGRVETNKRYQTRPQVALLCLKVFACQTDMTIGIDNCIATKVEPAVLKFIVYGRQH